MYLADGSKLKNIRVVGFNYMGNADDVTMVANMAIDKDKDGNEHYYNGINQEGQIDEEMLPVIEGRLKVNGSIYEDDGKVLKQYYPNLTLEVTGGYYVKFADAEVQRILVENFSADKVGMTSEDIEKVTDVGTVFKGNTAIESFDEFEKFTGVTAIGTEEWSDWKSAFKGCSELESITLPSSLKKIGYEVFSGCVKLTTANIYNVTRIWHQAFFGCTELHIDIDMPNASVVGLAAFSNSGINRVLNIGSITELGGGWGADEGVFRKCKSLTVAILPDTLTNIGIQVFAGCEALEALIVKNPTPPTCGGAVLDGSDNCKIYVPDVASEAYKTATNWSAYASRIFPISQLPSDNPTLYDEIKDYLN
jgi:hypothetical protein